MTDFVRFEDNAKFFYEQIDTEHSLFPSMSSHHYHDYFEIYFLERGECKYFIDDCTYSILPGDIVIVPERVIHRTLYTSLYKRTLLNFTSHFVPDCNKDISALPYIYRNSDLTSEIKHILGAISQECTTLDLYTEDSLKGLIHSLFYLFLRNENKARKTEANSPFVAEAVKLISESFSGDITLLSVAKMLSVSHEHLSRSFKKETGFGFNEYVTLVRLQKAEQMLVDEKDKNISDVAYACGFNDSNYFSDKFKRVYGLSPLKFRHKEENTIEK